MRFLLLSCTESKLTTPEPIPAIERYDGPTFRVVRRYLSTVSSVDVNVWIISAEHGLIASTTLVLEYDRVMTRERAEVLRPQVVPQLQTILQADRPNEVFILLGRTYQLVVNPSNAWIPKNATSVAVAIGGSGQKLTQLKGWLYRVSATDKAAPTLTQPHLIEEGQSGTATLRGVEVQISPSEILERVERIISEGATGYQATKEWVACVGEYQVSPKWLVSELSGVPVSKFVADEARRVLRQLGIAVKRVDESL